MQQLNRARERSRTRKGTHAMYARTRAHNKCTRAQGHADTHARTHAPTSSGSSHAICRAVMPTYEPFGSYPSVQFPTRHDHAGTRKHRCPELHAVTHAQARKERCAVTEHIRCVIIVLRMRSPHTVTFKLHVHVESLSACRHVHQRVRIPPELVQPHAETPGEPGPL